MATKEAVAHYEKEAEIARQHRMMEMIEHMAKQHHQIMDLLMLQKKQIENLNDQNRTITNDQNRTITAAMDVLSRAVQGIEERIKWLEENAHA
jgi:translation initiation factor 2 alpha subunit (eIF-2alpha)